MSFEGSQGAREDGGSKHEANDALKAQWGSSVAWSIVVSVGLHGAVLLLGPSWSSEAVSNEARRVEVLNLDWTVALDVEGVSGVGPAAAQPEPVEVAELSSSAGDDGRGEGGEGGGDVAWDVLQERLLGAARPRPTVVAPEPIAEVTPSAQRRDSVSRAVGTASTAELEEGAAIGALDLGRLAAVRPELAMVVPASWVLVRNPDEVDAFMSRVYSRGELEPLAEGSVDVTLWIDERGSVEWAEIAASSGRADMDEIALALFNEVARFRPARESGVSISRSVIFTVNFPW